MFQGVLLFQVGRQFQGDLQYLEVLQYQVDHQCLEGPWFHQRLYVL